MSWRTKLIFLLVVYFAGFATAVYCLAPAPQPTSPDSLPATRMRAALQSQEIARSMNSGMHKCLAFGKEAAWQTGAFLREKMDESRARSNSAAPQPATPRSGR